MVERTTYVGLPVKDNLQLTSRGQGWVSVPSGGAPTAFWKFSITAWPHTQPRITAHITLPR